MSLPPLSPKQLEFILNYRGKWNLLWGSVRSGKTICGIFSFLKEATECPDSQIYITGHTFDTAYRNIIKPIMEAEELSMFRPFCTWSGKKLYFRDKVMTVLGAKDEGAIGNFIGDTYSLIYCNEITLYPDSIIHMIDTRLSKPHSKAFADMNPTYPSHPLKEWIDKAEKDDPNYYAMYFNIDDNIFLPDHYKERLRNSLSGVFYKRNYLGLWCLAEGAIFDFFDKDIYVKKNAPRAAEYWYAGIDVGTSNAFACVLIGVSTGKYDQTGRCRWAEKEYVWDYKKQGRQKTNAELARDVVKFLEPYGVKQLYIDPSAAAFKVEMQRMGFHVIDANNDVYNGIEFLTAEMHDGNLFICNDCPNLIREIESYVWDPKASERGEDKPVKKDDHCIDALRYAIYSHQVTSYNPFAHNPGNYLKNRFGR